MDLAGKSHPRKSSTTSAAAAAVYSLTNHFSRLHPSSKPTKPQNLVDTHMQVKNLSKSVNFEPSIQKIGKQGKRVVFESDKKALVVVGERREKEIAPAPASASASASAAVTKAKKVGRELGEKERQNLIIKPTRTIEKVGLHGKIDRRRSFCDAQVELNNFLITTCAKVVSADMPPFMQIHAVGFARNTKDSLEKFTSKSLALSLKKVPISSTDKVLGFDPGPGSEPR